MYNWKFAGDEWSEPWGGPVAQWITTVYPRIHGFIPADNILEIGPGYGRWTHFLKGLCRTLTGVDIAKVCVEECRKRFVWCPHLVFHQNDGRSLAMVLDRSIDFVFSMDVFVHVDADVVGEYLRQIALKLREDGVGFIHHSNMLRYPNLRPPKDQFRAADMDQKLFERLCEDVGLQCVSQESIGWGQPVTTDCFSTFVRKGSKLSRPNIVFDNPDFMREADLARKLLKAYHSFCR